VKPKLWIILVWVAILSVIIGACVIYGGSNCEVPKSGPFHWLLKSEKFIPAHSRYVACRRVQ
jgi:hypothetical protein